jgi:hypothetical protein
MGSTSVSRRGHDVIFTDGMAVSLALFSISAVYVTKRMVPHMLSQSDSVPFYQRRRKSLQNLLQQSAIMDGGNSNTNQQTQFSSPILVDGMISKRGQTALLPVIAIQQQFFACIKVSEKYFFSFTLDFRVFHCCFVRFSNISLVHRHMYVQGSI